MSSGQVPGRRRTGRSARPRGLLIAAEGLDGSGKSATLEGIARWLEHRGRPVVAIAWRPSELVARAVLNPRSRPALTPRVAALLAAADAQGRIAARIERRLAAGTTVLADRYAWTAIAREVARGLEPDWSANLHAVLPAPDLLLYHRTDPGSAVAQALSGRPASVRSAAVGAAYGEFVRRLLLAYEQLVARAAQPSEAGQSRPWPTRLLVLAAGADPAASARLAGNALDELVASGARGGLA
ncbi:MAG: dTMP kinase [Candidatus Limnocylindrales bacterium]